MKKTYKYILVIVSVVILVSLTITCLFYSPKVQIGVSDKDRVNAAHSQKRYMEPVVVSVVSKLNLPVAEKVTELSVKIVRDSADVHDDIITYDEPSLVETNLEIEKSKVVITYSGTVTKNGESDEYLKSFEYDFGGLTKIVKH